MVRVEYAEYLADRGKLLRLEHALDQQLHKALSVGVLLAFQDLEVALHGRFVGEGEGEATAERTDMVQGEQGWRGVPGVVKHGLECVVLYYLLVRCQGEAHL